MKSFYVFIYKHVGNGRGYISKAWVLEEDLINFIKVVLEANFELEIVASKEDE